MKLLSLSIYTFSSPSQASLLSQASDLSEYSFLTRGSVQEGLNFLSSTVASRTTDGQRQSVQEGQNMANVYRKGNTAAVLISDTAYPVRVSFSLLNKILDEYTSDHWTKAVGDSKLAEYVRKYQDPKQADTIMKVQQELDETKIVLHKTIESVLERGEKLDNLVERSNALSAQSKMFYKTAKKPEPPMPSLPSTQQVWFQTKRASYTDAIELNPSAPIPALEPGHVLVKVSNVALNPVGYKTMGMLPSFVRKLPSILEFDLSGKVVDGNGSEFKIGDEVFGICPADENIKTGKGALGEYVLVKATNLTSKPANMSFPQACGISLVGLTAYQGLIDQCNVTAGQRVFINGGNTAVGRMAVQIAKNIGAYVVASCSGSSAPKVKELGADEIVNYQEVDLKTHLQTQYASQPFHAIYDAVGSPVDLFSYCAPFLDPKGSFLSIGVEVPHGLAGMAKYGASMLNSAVRPTWLGGVERKWIFYLTKGNKQDLDALGKWASEGKLHSAVDSTHSFDKAGVFAAYERMKSNKASGKVVITVSE